MKLFSNKWQIDRLPAKNMVWIESFVAKRVFEIEIVKNKLESLIEIENEIRKF